MVRRVRREACLVAGSSAGGHWGPACSEPRCSFPSLSRPPRRSRSETGRSRGGTRSIRWRPTRSPRPPASSVSPVRSVRPFVSARSHWPSLRSRPVTERGHPVPERRPLWSWTGARGLPYEAIVDIGAAAVRSYVQVPAGLQPSITLEECVECEAAIKRSPDFLAALRKRGVTDSDLVMIDAWSAGTYGDERPEERGKRLVRALAFVRSEPGDNPYARPLDGVTAVVDLHKMEVVRIDDHGVVPLPPEASNWAGEYLPRRGPI